MASNRRKSAAIALAVVGIAGLSLASAAQLNVNSASLGAGTDITASCDDSIEADFSTARGADGAYEATEIVLSDVAVACAGLDYRATLLTGPDGSQTPLAADTEGVVALDNGTFTVNVPDSLAESVTGVSVVIYG